MVLGDVIGSAFEYTVDADMREEDKCRVEYLKEDWTTVSAGRRL